jgi:hypothetical protein
VDCLRTYCLNTDIDAEADKLVRQVLDGTWEGLIKKAGRERSPLKSPTKFRLPQGVKNHKLSR